MENENENKMYVIRTYCYGKRPHESYLVTTADGSTVITEEPTLEALLANMGDSQYIPQEDIPHVVSALAAASGKESFGKEEELSFAKEMLARAITTYDASTAVNSFSLNGKSVWLDKATRVGLMNSTSIVKGMGTEITTLWLGEDKMEVDCDTAIHLLSALEMYALTCFNVTAAHKKAVAELESVEEVVAYDITTDYPDKLEMEV